MTSKQTIPTFQPLNPRESFAKVTCMFLEDWQAKRLTADEVCDTLLAAAAARNLIPPPRKDELSMTTNFTAQDEMIRKTRTHELALELVNQSVAGQITDATLDKILTLTLPPLKQSWVRQQVEGRRKQTAQG